MWPGDGTGNAVCTFASATRARLGTGVALALWRAFAQRHPWGPGTGIRCAPPPDPTAPHAGPPGQFARDDRAHPAGQPGQLPAASAGAQDPASVYRRRAAYRRGRVMEVAAAHRGGRIHAGGGIAIDRTDARRGAPAGRELARSTCADRPCRRGHAAYHDGDRRCAVRGRPPADRSTRGWSTAIARCGTIPTPST